ncbi:amino acid permease-domain-containing protein [Zopfochytrium polystomum]|nr:amino acid permease-domain-containing protein [Zopfochytrium polystomum]
MVAPPMPFSDDSAGAVEGEFSGWGSVQWIEDLDGDDDQQGRSHPDGVDQNDDAEHDRTHHSSDNCDRPRSSRATVESNATCPATLASTSSPSPSSSHVAGSGSAAASVEIGPLPAVSEPTAFIVVQAGNSRDSSALSPGRASGTSAPNARRTVHEDNSANTRRDSHQQQHEMGEWMATAIAANDLLGSVLYTTGVVCGVAGKFAPLSLLLVALSLFPFKRVIQDVMHVIPLNGGFYSVMILSSTKSLAAVAACCSVLDYTSTAVVSAASASAYLDFEFATGSIFWITVALLSIFGVLTMMGMKESYSLGVGILLFHLLTMAMIIVCSVLSLRNTGFALLTQNMNEPSRSNSYAYDIFIGYCVGMLGVTGFETSANYVEQMKPGVFAKTLRNMSFMVLGLNPVISLVSLALVPLASIIENQNTVLSLVANAAAGKWLRVLLAVDAFFVLSGGILTAFVGICGLLEHMVIDNLLPSFLLVQTREQIPIIIKNFFLGRKASKPHGKGKGSTPLLPTLFLFICVLLLIVFNGNVTELSLVFSMAFLAVLGMFVVCNAVLRIRMAKEVAGGLSSVLSSSRARGSWGGFCVLFSGALVVSAIIGNSIYNPQMITTFFAFFLGLLVIVSIILHRVRIGKIIAILLDASLESSRLAMEDDALPLSRLSQRLMGQLLQWVRRGRESPVGYFTKGEKLHHLNHVIQYVQRNEATSHLVIIHCYQDESTIPASLEQNCRVLDHVYPDLTIDLVLVKVAFNYNSVVKISRRLGIRMNQCLISRPWTNIHNLRDVEKVRTIMLMQ